MWKVFDLGKTFHPNSVHSSTAVTSATTTLRKKSSATSTPFYTRRLSARAMQSSYGSIFRACRFRNQERILRRFQSWAGPWYKRTCCASYREPDRRSIMGRAIIQSRQSAIHQPIRRSRSTRLSPSSRFRRRCGISTLAGIRCSTNT
jgi:hypothetical protein